MDRVGNFSETEETRRMGVVIHLDGDGNPTIKYTKRTVLERDISLFELACEACQGKGHMNDGWIRGHTKCETCKCSGRDKPTVEDEERWKIFVKRSTISSKT